MSDGSKTLPGTWRERPRRLRNIPPLLSIVWQSGRGVVAAGLSCRVAAALIPLAMLAVSKRILDAVQAHSAGIRCHRASGIWWRRVRAGGLAGVLGRAIGYFDALLADRFTRHVSMRVMEHASRLDLASYEDPRFYDKLERARVQATDRIAMIQALGAVCSRSIAAVTLSAGIFWFSPWLLVLLVVAVVPAFLGESHFAFLGYSLNIRPDTRATPARLSASAGRQQGIGEGAEAVRLERFSVRRIHAALESRSTTRTSAWRGGGCGRARLLSLLSTARLLRRLRVRDLSDRDGRL